MIYLGRFLQVIALEGKLKFFIRTLTNLRAPTLTIRSALIFAILAYVSNSYRDFNVTGKTTVGHPSMSARPIPSIYFCMALICTLSKLTARSYTVSITAISVRVWDAQSKGSVPRGNGVDVVGTTWVLC